MRTFDYCQGNAVSLVNRVRDFWRVMYCFCHAVTIGMHHTVGNTFIVRKQKYRDFIVLSESLEPYYNLLEKVHSKPEFLFHLSHYLLFW